MSKGLWSRPAPVPEGSGGKSAVMELPSPEEVAAESHELLVAKGWCLWCCHFLGGDIIVVIIDGDVTGYPGGYPVYTLQELKDILPLEDHELLIAHEAKRKLGARIEDPT